MKKQRYEEPTGTARITCAYNLPSKYVIHTVGPIVSGRLTECDCGLLADCYNSCLELAVQLNFESIAFCCISTGVFGFPQREAADIAVSVVSDFIASHSINVIFNVFKDEDLRIYKKIFAL